MIQAEFFRDELPQRRKLRSDLKVIVIRIVEQLLPVRHVIRFPLHFVHEVLELFVFHVQGCDVSVPQLEILIRPLEKPFNVLQ
ncbi:hypothetical protein D3C76_1473370 [compost metagenome]